MGWVKYIAYVLTFYPRFLFRDDIAFDNLKCYNNFGIHSPQQLFTMLFTYSYHNEETIVTSYEANLVEF